MDQVITWSSGSQKGGKEGPPGRLRDQNAPKLNLNDPFSLLLGLYADFLQNFDVLPTLSVAFHD